MTAYYNENDPYAAEWLRNLIKSGEIADGEVDTRSIEDVTPNDLRGFTQFHFFAGIGGWSKALRLAGWPDSRPAWTGSCPCQPFSQAGKGAGTSDVRHLWPDWMHLIRQCRPDVIFGEQVASAIRFGWLDTVFDDLENSGYACGAANIPAASVGAPHLRERVWFVGALADDASIGRQDGNRVARNAGRRAGSRPASLRRGDVGELAITNSGRGNIGQGWRGELADGGELGNAENGELRQPCPGDESQAALGGSSVFAVGNVGNADSNGCEPGHIATAPAGFGDTANAANWDGVEWLACIDGKSRPTEPGLSPLAHGIPKNMGQLRAELLAMGIDAKNAKRLAKHAGGLLRSARAFRGQQIRGYGNAIVPQVAAEFIRSLM
jgi:DNA (cytosine-5)-methyltransferase 1